MWVATQSQVRKIEEVLHRSCEGVETESGKSDGENARGGGILAYLPPLKSLTPSPEIRSTGTPWLAFIGRSVWMMPHFSENRTGPYINFFLQKMH